MTDKISNERLLPCPFCGLSDAHLINGGPGNHYVRCDHCLASTDDGSKERAIAAWNRRQSPEGVEVKPSAILSQIALWSDDEGLELSMSQGNDLVRRIMSVVRAAGISEQMLIDAFIRGESWRKRNDVDRYVAVPEMVNKAARDYADAALSSEAHNG